MALMAWLDGPCLRPMNHGEAMVMPLMVALMAPLALLATALTVALLATALTVALLPLTALTVALLALTALLVACQTGLVQPCRHGEVAHGSMQPNGKEVERERARARARSPKAAAATKAKGGEIVAAVDATRVPRAMAGSAGQLMTGQMPVVQQAPWHMHLNMS